MPRTAALALLLALAPLGCQGTAVVDDNAPEEAFTTVIPPDDGLYFPTTVGAKSVFQETINEPPSVPRVSIRTYVVTQVGEKGGAKIVTQARLNRKGEPTSHVTWKVAGDGLYVMMDGNPSDLLLDLKLPHKPGAEWRRRESDSLSVRDSRGPVELTVPAGTFTAIGVSWGAGPLRYTYWYAQAVGLVKSELTDSRGKGQPVTIRETVLKAFRPGTE